MLNNVRVVLVEPSHPGNIGSTARAMKNMGISSLFLVNPVLFPHQSATMMAAGADDILSSAQIVTTLESALTGVTCAMGTSARQRSLEWPLCPPREAAYRAVEEFNADVALVFGRENSGLTNDELSLCQYHIHIPTNEKFSSLNLSQAVQIMCYELRMAFLSAASTCASDVDSESLENLDLATTDDLIGMTNHLKETLVNLEVLNLAQPKLLMNRLKRLFYRARLDKTEVNILRGIFSAINKRLKK